MNMTSSDPGETLELRQRAEEKVKAREARIQDAQPLGSAEDMLHELRVYQVELEMQNEELRRVQEKLEASRERYFDLYDLAPVGYVTLSQKGLILEANLTLARQLGLPRGALAMKPFTHFILPEDQDTYYLHRKRLFDTGTPQMCELRMLRRDNAPLWAQMEATAALDEKGAPVCRAAVADITARKQAEAEGHRLEVLLRHHQRLQAIGTLAGGVAHEINNPINGIMNYAQLIKDRMEGRDAALQEYAGGIIQETERIAAIIRALLTFARHEPEEQTPTDMSHIVASTLSLIGASLRSDRIMLDTRIPADLPEPTCCSQQIQQVMMNLLTNARDALNEKYPGYDANKKISITAHTFERDGCRWLRTTVADTGSGISKADLERVFDPFYTTKRPNRGTGLGLSISQGTAKDHGGRLSVESEEGRFTRFHLDLPAEESGKTHNGPSRPSVIG